MNTAENVKSDVIGAKEVAEMLQVTMKTVHTYQQKKYIPGTKIGGIYRFSRKAIEKYVPSPVPSEDNGPLSERNA